MLRAGLLLSASLACLGACGPRTARPAPAQSGDREPALWKVYHDALAGAKYVDLTHTITPTIPVWPGFGHPTFGPTVDPKTGKPYRWAKDGFEATRYVLPPISSAPSSIRPPTGAPTIPPSTSCRRPSPSGRWS